MSVAKIVELVGSSNKSWEDAAQVAVNDAIKTIRGIRTIIRKLARLVICLPCASTGYLGMFF
jgi:hypothetical protein